MPNGLLPIPLEPLDTLPTDPQLVVEAFLAALAAKDAQLADRLIDDEIHYVNVGFPAVHGRSKMAKVFALLQRDSVGFEVFVHSIAADGPIVLTERTDVLIFGPLRVQIWVWGRFDVSDGRITLWRDSFDLIDIVRATARGVLGAVVPALGPKVPVGLDSVPGRLRAEGRG